MSPSLPSFLGMWAAMLAAMMSPLLINPLRHLRDRSLPRHRARAGLLFVVSYAGIWTLGGIALLGMADLLDRFGPAITLGFGAVIFWQLTPAKQRCLNRHHARPPLAVFGRAADLDSLHFGASSACWCFGSCWGLMLLPLVIMSDQLALMAMITVWIWAEGFSRPRRPSWGVGLPMTAVRILGAAVWPPAIRGAVARLPTV